MALIDIEKLHAFDHEDTVIKCRVCNAVMEQKKIDFQDRLASFVIGANSTIFHYKCPDCKRELITMEK
jgi:ribosomal protein S27E